MIIRFLFLVLCFTLNAQVLWAKCKPLDPKEEVVWVHSCRLIDPQVEPVLVEFVNEYPKHYPYDQREKFQKQGEALVERYRGVVLDVEINGQKRKLFDKGNKTQCPRYDSVKKMTLTIHRACCDGDPSVPCLLGISEYVSTSSETMTLKEFEDKCERTGGTFLDCESAFTKQCENPRILEARNVVCSCPKASFFDDEKGCRPSHVYVWTDKEEYTAGDDIILRIYNQTNHTLFFPQFCQPTRCSYTEANMFYCEEKRCGSQTDVMFSGDSKAIRFSAKLADIGKKHMFRFEYELGERRMPQVGISNLFTVKSP